MSFEAEFSAVLARGRSGETGAFPLTRNRHEGGILRTSTVPAGPEIEAMAGEAIAASKAIEDALDHVGVGVGVDAGRRFGDDLLARCWLPRALEKVGQRQRVVHQ